MTYAKCFTSPVSTWSTNISIQHSQTLIWHPSHQYPSSVGKVSPDSLLSLLLSREWNLSRGSFLKEPDLRDVDLGRPGRYLCKDRDITTINPPTGTKLWRVIHSTYHANGLYARSVNPTTFVDVSGLDQHNFQLHLENHLDWHCEMQSPFLSLTDEASIAIKRFNDFQARQYLRIIEVDVAGMLLWKVADLVRDLGLESKRSYQHEYIRAFVIPEACTALIDIESLKVWQGRTLASFPLEEPRGNINLNRLWSTPGHDSSPQLDWDVWLEKW